MKERVGDEKLIIISVAVRGINANMLLTLSCKQVEVSAMNCVVLLRNQAQDSVVLYSIKSRILVAPSILLAIRYCGQQSHCLVCHFIRYDTIRYEMLFFNVRS